MSEDARRPEYTPLNLHPFVGLDLGERWGREVGELSQRLTHVEQGVARLELKTDALDAKVDRLETAVIRLDERMAAQEKRFDERMTGQEKRFDDKFTVLEKRLDGNTRLLWSMFMTLLAAIIAQKFI